MITPSHRQPALGKVKRTGEHFSWYSGDYLRAKIEPPSCQQSKLGDLLAVRPLNCAEIIHKDNYDKNRANTGVPSCGRSRPGDGNDNNDGEGEDDTHSLENGTGKGKGSKHGKGKGMVTEDGKDKGKGKGKEKEKGNGKEKGIVKLIPGEKISLVLLLCSCRRKCLRQTRTRRVT